MVGLSALIQYRYLLWQWTAREVRVRYKQSLLGAAWAILQPLALTAIFTVVFSLLVRVDTGGVPYPVFAYSALVPWTFFTTSLSLGIPSLVNNMNLVTKIYFPREILPLGTVFAALLDLAVALSVLAAMLAYYRITPGAGILWVLPLLGIQVLFTIAVTLLGSAVIVFFRDMRFVVPLVTQVWMYATPVVYPVDLVPERLQTLYFLNPMAGTIDGYRRVLVLGQAPRTDALLLALGVTLVSLVVAYVLFRRMEPHFADVI